MNNHVTLATVLKRLGEAGLRFEMFGIGGGLSVVILERGARLLGPFESPDSESILWMNGFWNDRSAFADAIRGGAYDMGGERFWVEPEFAFFTKEKLRFHETYIVQPSLDPANYSLEKSGEGFALSADVDCEVYEMPITRKSFSIRKYVHAAQNPIRHIRDADRLMDGVAFGGYDIRVALRDTSPENEMLIGPWFLAQVNPEGQAIVPFAGSLDYVDFYEPVTDEYQSVESGCVRLKITGDCRYKTGYRSAQTFGRAAYVNGMEDGRAYAIVRNYYNDPSQPYCAEPFEDLGNRGCSLFFYNDSGKLGGFAEMENSGIPIGGATGRSEGESVIGEWFFVGEREKVNAIVDILLGFNPVG
jgi:hypothetical protein